MVLTAVKFHSRPQPATPAKPPSLRQTTPTSITANPCLPAPAGLPAYTKTPTSTGAALLLVPRSCSRPPSVAAFGGHRISSHTTTCHCDHAFSVRSNLRVITIPIYLDEATSKAAPPTLFPNNITSKSHIFIFSLFLINQLKNRISTEYCKQGAIQWLQ